MVTAHRWSNKMVKQIRWGARVVASAPFFQANRHEAGVHFPQAMPRGDAHKFFRSFPLQPRRAGGVNMLSSCR